MTHPAFDSLTPMPEDKSRRYVNGSWMEREEYDVCDWQLLKTYTTDSGNKGSYWAAPLAGLLRYSELRRQRRAEKKQAWQARQEADDSWSSHVESLIEREKP